MEKTVAEMVTGCLRTMKSCYMDLLALNLSETYRHKTGTRPPSCQTPQQPTIYVNSPHFSSHTHDTPLHNFMTHFDITISTFYKMANLKGTAKNFVFLF